MTRQTEKDIKSIKKDLTDFHREYVDIYWLHLPNDMEDNLKEMIKLYNEGKIHNIGISNFNLEECKRAKSILDHAGIPLYGVQNHYSLINREWERKGVIAWCKEHGINFWAWFEDQYGPNANVDRFMIISTKTLSYEGDFTHKVKIIRPNKLKILKDQIKGFIKELKPFSLDEISDDTLHEFLTLHHLNVEDFSEQYSEEYYHKTR